MPRGFSDTAGCESIGILIEEVSVPWELFVLSHHPGRNTWSIDVDVHWIANCTMSVLFMKMLFVGAESDTSAQSPVKVAVKLEDATIMLLGLLVELSIRDQLKLKLPEDGPASLMSVHNHTCTVAFVVLSVW
jgi:hypothetical protein